FTHSTFILSSDGNGGTIVVDPCQSDLPQSNSSATASSLVAAVDPGHDSFVFKPDLGVEGSSNVSSGPLSISETHELHMASDAASAQALLDALETNHNDWFNLANHDNMPAVHVGPAEVHAAPHPPLIG